MRNQGDSGKFGIGGTKDISIRRDGGGRSISRTIAFWLILFVLWGVALEVFSRGFWFVRHGISPFHPSHIRYVFYPELRNVEHFGDQRDLDVLLLGGSALHREFGNIEGLLADQLSSRLHREVRVLNLASPAHTSLDSYYKYKYLSDYHFRAVVVYHGINEVRANNCPDSIFRENYAHYSWYASVHALEGMPFVDWLTWLYTLRHLWVQAAPRLGMSVVVPQHGPIPAWLEYGTFIKTAKPFRTNLANMVELAKSRDESIVLMTYAFYVPVDYSYEKFKNKSLDYVRHVSPIELWGTPSNVVQGITVHNTVIQELVHKDGAIRFVDQHASIPKAGRYFDDICHLSEDGQHKLVDNMLEEVTDVLLQNRVPGG